MIEIKLAKLSDLEEAQEILNHKDNIGLLGGFTLAETLKQKIKQNNSMWLAYFEEKMVGVTMFGGRPQSHLVKYGEIAVLPEYRRKRIATSMYFAMTCQGVIEGRRLFEDSIVGDNPTQFNVLPTLGLKLAGELEHKTASAKSICLFQFSMLWEGAFERMYQRVPQDTTIEIAGGYYADDLFEKNSIIYKRHSPEYLTKAKDYRDSLLKGKYGINVIDIVRSGK